MLSSGSSRRETMIFLPASVLLRRVSGGYSGLLAGIYWTRAVQYYGRHRLAQAQEYALLGALLDITTGLDPHLLIAYRFGSIFLAGKAPEGAGDPQRAVHLLERGIVANPEHWRLWEDLGFIYYWDMKDYAHAARAFRAGSERPGALPWMRVLGAVVAARGGDLQTSRLLWSEIARTAGNNAIRRSAQAHLAAMEAKQLLEMLDAVLADYCRRRGAPSRISGKGAELGLDKARGRCLPTMHDLIAGGYLRGVPRDPTGEPLTVGPDGRARLGPGSKIDLGLAE